jgi:putative ABC transport system ATP-binding protein
MKELSCHNLCFSRSASGEKAILEDVNCSFSSGEVTLITGITGAGKSTLLHILAGMIRPTSGEVKSDGRPVSRWVTAHKDLWRRKVGIVFQQPHLMRGLTALENVMTPLIPRGWSLSEIRNAGMESLEKLRAGHLAGKGVSGLSGGERQKIAIARSLAALPEALLADEPTAHQDDDSTGLMLDVFKEKSLGGCLVVIAAHDHRILKSGIADHHYTIENGRVHKAE